MKEIIIDGNRFSDIEDFYTEIDRLLTRDLDWKTGHNLNAFNDLLCGGLGFHEYGEALHVTWINASKSKKDLGYEAADGQTMFDVIVEIILGSDDTGHYCTLDIIDLRERKKDGVNKRTEKILRNRTG